MYYNYYEQNSKKEYGIFDLKKILICIVLVIAVLLLKKIDIPLTKLALSKINYYVFNYTYDFKSLADTLRGIPKVAENIPAFKQTDSNLLLSPASGKITSPFGMRVHPILKVERMHNGIDIDQKEGTPVKAVLDGIVLQVGEDQELGRFVKLKHQSDLVTVYGHLKDVNVKQNEEVKRGSVIGTVGKTGLAETAHLHFEIWKNNIPQDPEKWVKIP